MRFHFFCFFIALIDCYLDKIIIFQLISQLRLCNQYKKNETYNKFNIEISASEISEFRFGNHQPGGAYYPLYNEYTIHNCLFYNSFT